MGGEVDDKAGGNKRGMMKALPTSSFAIPWSWQFAIIIPQPATVRRLGTSRRLQVSKHELKA